MLAERRESKWSHGRNHIQVAILKGQKGFLTEGGLCEEDPTAWFINLLFFCNEAEREKFNPVGFVVSV